MPPKRRGSPEPSPSPTSEAPAAGRPIAPVLFEPAIGATHLTRPAGRRWLTAAALVAVLAALAAVALYLVAARSVALRFEPAADRAELRGGWIRPELGGRYLLLPGRYSVVAEKAGYRPIDVEIDVGSEARQELNLDFRKLPGVLELNVSSGAGGAGDLDWTLSVDGEVRDSPDGALELEPGRYAVRVEAPRHRAAEVEVELAGAGAVERVELTLDPLWATLRFESEPSGARLRVDGRDSGQTPTSVELLEGPRVYTLTRAGYAPRRGSVTVVAGQDQKVGPVRLRPSDGNVAVTSQPAGATVRVGGAYRGETPLDLALAPGREHTLLFEKAGHTAVERSLRLEPGEAREVHAELAEELGELELQIFPADARVRLNGVDVEARTLKLPTARDHRIEVDRQGYVAQSLDVRATPGQTQRVDVRLETAEAEREREIQSLDRTSEGQRLALIEPGSFQMGASRRESGRRANETLREVELTRRFYLSAHEVTNAQFRRFRPEHRSGAVGGFSLDLDDHPVVQVSWQDAAAYCNWLSEKEGLEPAYVKEGDVWVAKGFDGAPPTGYRLPSEAEWAWVARYPGGGAAKGLKYPWGTSLPPPPKAGNFADASASDLVSATLPDYRDGYAATAPVDAFPANALGVHQLGGNVAEWVNDIYVVRPALLGAVERDPRGPKTGDLNVIRGSSWRHSTITELRLSFRDYGSEARADVGFRIARPVP